MTKSRDDVYRSEDVCFRDAGRQLADIRDSAVMVQTLDELTGDFPNELKNGAVAEIRQELADMHEQAKQTILDKHDTAGEVANTIQKAKERVVDWPIQGHDFSALADGLKRVYKRGRKRMRDTYETQTTEDFHDWRKRVKYLWYQISGIKCAF
ncbi:CHAD domain-containing protein [candidate division KSB1 bacterium]|nr:CHAD domain-containing protein [candidate division KSB1 bacterium]NIR69814.1 CHAD domain-containing protein [candidate division KSB1 bacterium]NIS25805.1 CHAD domain-containing protein [candidate division KSB1 bacterium]NIT72679.1 CHAD domain-containing protein [candidate division KSB1 bacterium]NIU26494.1 CHAD domain-containing protein [candidate division KSB1 bacterium]